MVYRRPPPRWHVVNCPTCGSPCLASVLPAVVDGRRTRVTQLFDEKDKAHPCPRVQPDKSTDFLTEGDFERTKRKPGRPRGSKNQRGAVAEFEQGREFDDEQAPPASDDLND